MSQTIEEIRSSLAFILRKLENIESKIEIQEKDIKAYIGRCPESIYSNSLLIVAGLKSTRTSFELLRDKIDEISGPAVTLVKECNL